MKTLEKIAFWIRKKTSDSEEFGSYSAGYWPSIVRKTAAGMVPGWEGIKILDVGCGEGLFLSELACRMPEAEIQGVDSWDGILRQARQKVEKMKFTNVNLKNAKATELPFSDGCFDAIVCINTIFNMKDWDEVRNSMSEMVRVCKNHGRIIIDIRNKLNPVLWLKYRFAKYYDSTLVVPLKTYSPGRVAGLLRKMNCTVIRKRGIGFFCWLFAPIILFEVKKNAIS